MTPTDLSDEQIAVSRLRQYEQADESGVMVLASRQTIDEAAALIESMALRVRGLERQLIKTQYDLICRNTELFNANERAEASAKDAWRYQFMKERLFAERHGRMALARYLGCEPEEFEPDIDSAIDLAAKEQPHG